MPVDGDGVHKVEQLSEDVDLITLRNKIPGSTAIEYQQFTWNRKTHKDARIRKLVCF